MIPSSAFWFRAPRKDAPSTLGATTNPELELEPEPEPGTPNHGNVLNVRKVICKPSASVHNAAAASANFM
jgi:hypothetical protein